MIMRPEPIAAALKAALRSEYHEHPARPGWRAVPADDRPRTCGREHLLFVCPRYEGVDHRVRGMVDLELSVGDYVLSGGELPAMVVIDAVLRLLPGAIDAAVGRRRVIRRWTPRVSRSTRDRPSSKVQAVPEILLSGDHGAVDSWRREQSRARTEARRPDLIEGAMYTPPPDKNGKRSVRARATTSPTTKRVKKQ